MAIPTLKEIPLYWKRKKKVIQHILMQREQELQEPHKSLLTKKMHISLASQCKKQKT